MRELLGARNMAHVATLTRDGAPHVTPVWIALEDDRLAIYVGGRSLKARGLRRDGRIAISVADERNPYRSATIRGRVVQELGGDEAHAVMDRMSNRFEHPGPG